MRRQHRVLHRYNACLSPRCHQISAHLRTSGLRSHARPFESMWTCQVNKHISSQITTADHLEGCASSLWGPPSRTGIWAVAAAAAAAEDLVVHVSWRQGRRAVYVLLQAETSCRPSLQTGKLQRCNGVQPLYSPLKLGHSCPQHYPR
jgi:hypothetical protein